MKLTAKQLNRFVIYKLPAAFFCGVRIQQLKDELCMTSVKHNWINKNPFHSIYFAVLAMAAELASGALVLKHTKESNVKFSTLVVGLNAQFLKKAVGTIHFTCNHGTSINQQVKKAIETKQSVDFFLNVVGVNEDCEQVAVFDFHWSIKPKLL